MNILGRLLEGFWGAGDIRLTWVLVIGVLSLKTDPPAPLGFLHFLYICCISVKKKKKD